MPYLSVRAAFRYNHTSDGHMQHNHFSERCSNAYLLECPLDLWIVSLLQLFECLFGLLCPQDLTEKGVYAFMKVANLYRKSGYKDTTGSMKSALYLSRTTRFVTCRINFNES